MKYFFQLLLLIVFCTSAAAQQASTPDDGTVTDGTYSNRFFGFKFTYPKGWVVHGEPTNAQIRDVGKERLVSAGALSEADSNAVLKKTYQLLTVFQHPLGTPGITLNSLVQIVGEDVRHAPGITDGKAYFWHTVPMMLKIGARRVQPQPVEISLGGRQFYRQDFDAEVNGISYTQAHLIGVFKGYVLAFILTASNRAKLEEMFRSVHSISFDSSPGVPTSKP